MPLIGAFPRRLVVAALAVGVLGCDRRPCASDPAAAVSAEQAVVFFETNQGGVSILSATGRRIKTLRIPPGQSVDSLTPDLSGWSFAQVRRGDPRRGTSELVVYVSWPQKGAYEVLRQEIDSAKSTAVGSYELQWITADGAAFFLRNLDELSLVRLCGSQLSHLPVAKDVAAFAHTDTRLYTLSRNKIRWRGIPESAQDHERGERVVPEAFDGVEIGPSPDQLVLFRKPPARAPARSPRRRLRSRPRPAGRRSRHSRIPCVVRQGASSFYRNLRNSQPPLHQSHLEAATDFACRFASQIHGWGAGFAEHPRGHTGSWGRGPHAWTES